MKYFILPVLTLLALLPQHSSATPLAGSFYGDTTNGPVWSANDPGGNAVPFNILRVSVSGSDPEYVYDWEFTANFDAYAFFYLSLPDMNNPLQGLLTVVNTGIYQNGTMNPGVDLYFLISGFLNEEYGAYGLEFTGSQPLSITDVTPYDTSAVPEPSTAALVALGIGGVLYRFRRR
ncbi:PEP-CTERM sorting domain-containing protein [Bryobacter aggregatus]|uniref:PEP-CTERM sorting domain-containing protein n=1 Tax=Bryobacter aggregatus TaxID=360054 RepID=UPI0004E0CA91|nr:PEP-CTERM sorting domain-containing protein [Bryobacter aggregatus]